MTQPWAAERVVDTRLAGVLIESQFPSLAPVSAEPFGEGWDNTAYEINRTLVFRFPRREIAVPMTDRLGLDDRQRSELACPLGKFLSALHGLSASGVGGDALGRLNVERLAARIRKSPAGIESIVRDSLGFRPDSRTVLVHGDLYARHLMVDDDIRLRGVIDWGDVHLNDPAVDLSIAWSFLPPAAREEFREAYGPIDEPSWRLARLRALHYGIVLLDYGQGSNDPMLVGEARTILRLVATE